MYDTEVEAEISYLVLSTEQIDRNAFLSAVSNEKDACLCKNKAFMKQKSVDKYLDKFMNKYLENAI